MKIGLIDVDGHRFPSLPLMKLSSWHKQKGDTVTWYEPLFTGYCDRVYLSKVFTTSDDFAFPINSPDIRKGGTGYFYPDGGEPLSEEVEHCYPDYALYQGTVLEPVVRDTAFGFLTRGCPRGCDFCIVKEKEGLCSKKVADLSEFWKGQKNIKLLDPNLFACKEWRVLCDQLIESKALVDFTQGVDVRIMNEEKLRKLKQIRVKRIHFAWDRYQDKEVVVPKLREAKQFLQYGKRECGVYVLCNHGESLEECLERIYTIRDIGFHPYVMLFHKEELEPGSPLLHLQRWVNNRRVFSTVQRFEDYK